MLISGHAETISNSGNVSASLDATGAYSLHDKNSGWDLSGHLPGPAQGLAVSDGSDPIGAYHQLAFTFTDAGSPMSGVIRLYDGKDVAYFSQTDIHGSVAPPAPFPDFTGLPHGLFAFSYKTAPFAPLEFHIEQTSTPCLLFDANDRAVIVSPAAHFVCASMIGDGQTRLGSGFTSTLKNIPAGFTQPTLVAFGQGINHTWDLWGNALTDLNGKKRPANDADPLLKYYGYWTDHGGAYWYNYDPERGYQGTLEDLVASYRTEGIPIRYLQLDSWWYDKTTTRFDGKIEGPKNPALPEGEWNRYGGTLQYKADPFIFPNGMAAFHEKVDLPFITHNRWIDPTSPYHAHYKISGLAAIDPAFWNEIASYLKESGVFCYEQDWMHNTIAYSPGLTSTVDEGDAFFESMAGAFKAQGLSMQYCMAPPAGFLEGSKFDNLTTIRVSGDGFNPKFYHRFLYTSRLAASMGIFPWTDVYKSTEIGNLILGVLSDGPVGTGDAMGQESKANILTAARADGVLVKPDVPILPVDSAYLAEAQGKNLPTLATTYTDHNGIKTIYGVAILAPGQPAGSVTVDVARDLGCTGPAYLYHYLDGTGETLAPGASFTLDVQPGQVAYFVLAPIGPSGIAFLGDANKIVGTGKARIADLKDDGHQVTATILLAPGEKEVKICGYAEKKPRVSLENGEAVAVVYNADSKFFTAAVNPPAVSTPTSSNADFVRKLTVAFGT